MRLRWRDGKELLFDVVRNHPKANEVAAEPLQTAPRGWDKVEGGARAHD